MTPAALADLCDRALDALGPGVDGAVTASSVQAALTRFANSRIHQNVADEGVSLTIKAIVDGATASASTRDVSPEAIARVAAAAVEAARLRPADPDWPGLAPPSDPTPVDHYDEATRDADPDTRAEAVAQFVSAGDGLEAAGFCSTSGGEYAFANTAGQRATGRTSNAAIDGIHRTGRADGSAGARSARLADLDGATLGAIAATKARAADEATDLEPGVYEVVLEPGCVADMFTFLGFYGFSGKSVQDGTSFVHLGEQQFDPELSVWDDITDPRAIGLGYDHEGTPKQRMDLIRAGETTGIVHDRRTAAKAGTQSTGHASPSEAFGPVAGNLFVGEGPNTREQLIGAVERGLLVTDFWYTRI
ncbi:MAG: TldD/PmbA family protein, partial [Acidimicrobiales bacterium]